MMASLLWIVLLQNPALEEIVSAWGRDEVAVRDAATQKALDGWQGWSGADLARLRVLAKGGDEVGSRAGLALARIEARRLLGAKIVAALPQADVQISSGRAADRVALVRDAAAVLSDGDQARIAALLETTDWGDQALPLIDVLPRRLPWLGLGMKLLKHPDLRVRRSAAILATWLPDSSDRCASGVILVDEESVELRLAGLRLLQTPTARPHAARIRKMTAAPEAEVRHEAAFTLGLLGDSELGGPIVECLRDADPWARLGAVWGLHALGAADRAPALVPLLKDRDTDIRGAAIRALARLGATDHLEAVLARLEDPEPEVRVSAAAAAAALGAGLKEFRPLLDHAQPGIRLAAVRSVGRLDPRVQAAEGMKFLEERPPGFLTPLVEALVDGALRWSAEDRERLAKALERLDQDRVIPGVTNLALMRLGRKSKEDRAVFLDALGAAPRDHASAWTFQNRLDAVHPEGAGPLSTIVPGPPVLRTDEELRRLLGAAGLRLEGTVVAGPRLLWNRHPVAVGSLLRHLLPPDRTYLLDGDVLRILTWEEAIEARRKSLAGD